MADVKIVDIDGEQWNIKDQVARDKNIEQDTKIENLTAEVHSVNGMLERFYYDADVDARVLQNRINAMIHCYNNSKGGVATIRYERGYYYNVILPAADLNIEPNFIEIGQLGEINVIGIKSNTDYTVIKSI